MSTRADRAWFERTFARNVTDWPRRKEFLDAEPVAVQVAADCVGVAVGGFGVLVGAEVLVGAGVFVLVGVEAAVVFVGVALAAAVLVGVGFEPDPLSDIAPAA